MYIITNLADLLDLLCIRNNTGLLFILLQALLPNLITFDLEVRPFWASFNFYIYIIVNLCYYKRTSHNITHEVCGWFTLLLFPPATLSHRQSLN